MEAISTVSTQENSKPKVIPHPWRDPRDQCHHPGLEGCSSDSYHILIQLSLTHAEDRWILENDSGLFYCMLNQVVIPIAAAVADAVSLPEQINTSPGTLYAAIDVANAFSPYLSIMPTGSSLLSTGKASNTHTVLPQRHINPPVLCHNSVCKNLSHLFLPKGIILAHCIDGIIAD